MQKPIEYLAEQTYRLIIDAELYQYMMTLAELSAPNEILGIGMISKKEHDYYMDFVVEEVFVPRQEVSHGYCTFAEGAQNEIIDEVLARGDSVEELCFRWHSHGYASVFFSPTDEKDIDNCDSPYVVNLVVNAYKDVIARLDVLEPVRVRNIPLEIVIDVPIDDTVVTECADEIAANCKILPKQSFVPQKEEPEAVKICQGVRHDDATRLW